ncbi:hypothetical protein [Dietzia cinnamea]|uniref:hypothetical protein n=1 Tax=Dietzia cinnamea TaxID=321318 RepID=UPI00223BEA4A|nr:hypothetical protein [Dietzia cinnamea]MCT2076066.1 hypothetical protein [Dietzia cinnamea]MCT2219793.1 hypothetical protein [Dietzia cinnamea]
MEYAQARTPNLDPVIYQGGQVLTGWLGYCLAYVQTAYGAPWAGSNAWEAWSYRVKKRHGDWNMPSGVYVPIWFDGYWNGQRLGHVAIWKDGRIWSSPWTSNKPSADVLGSIADVERIYGMRFVGWSEDIGGVDVIRKKETSVAIIQNAENWYGRCNKTHVQIRGRELGREVFKSFVGQDFLKFVEVCSDDPEADTVQNWQNVGRTAVTDNWQGQIHTLRAQVNDLGKRPTQAQLDAAAKKVEDIAKSMDAARVKAEEAELQAKAAADELAKNKAEMAQSKKEADNFLTALLNAVRGMFGGKS